MVEITFSFSRRHSVQCFVSDQLFTRILFMLEGEEVQPVTLEEAEKQHIARTLQVTRTMGEAADVLGIHPKTLVDKRKRLGLYEDMRRANA